MLKLEIFKDSEKIEEDLWHFRLIKHGKIVQESLDPLPRENMHSFTEGIKEKHPDVVISDPDEEKHED